MAYLTKQLTTKPLADANYEGYETLPTDSSMTSDDVNLSLLNPNTSLTA